MRHKIEMTADEKMWKSGSARFPVVVLVLLSGIDIVRFAILGDKDSIYYIQYDRGGFYAGGVYGMEKQNAIFISADCSDGFCSVF